MRHIKFVAGALIGLTCATAIDANAQSVEVYGLVGMYAGTVKRSGDAAPVQQLGGGGLTTSFIGFRGKEELADHLKAIYSLESFFRSDTGDQGRNATDPLFSRNAWVGIEGKFGRLSFGRQTNPTYGVMSRLSPFGSSVVFSPLALQSAGGECHPSSVVTRRDILAERPRLPGRHQSEAARCNGSKAVRLGSNYRVQVSRIVLTPPHVA